MALLHLALFQPLTSLSPLLSNMGHSDLIQRHELTRTPSAGIYAKETLWFSQIELVVPTLLLKRPLARIQNMILFILNQN